jgi:anti-anti-sigma factor
MDMGPSEGRAWWVLLPAEPQLESELALLRNRIGEAGDVDLVLDLSRVETIYSPGLGILLSLHRLLSRSGRRLILCRARLATKCIFRIAGLDVIFDFAEDKTEALSILGRPPGGLVESRPEEGSES